MAAVIDTNVLLVANGSHADISAACRKACIERLLFQQKRGVTVIDDGYRILSEYQNKTHPNQPKGVGDAFLKWLLQNKKNVRRVHQVPLNEMNPQCYEEFPDRDLEECFDPSDRKFVAVSNSHPEKPAIWQAADCKWLDWWAQLHAAGIAIEFICPQDACGFYRKKFPGKVLPVLPKQ